MGVVGSAAGCCQLKVGRQGSLWHVWGTVLHHKPRHTTCLCPPHALPLTRAVGALAGAGVLSRGAGRGPVRLGHLAGTLAVVAAQADGAVGAAQAVAVDAVVVIVTALVAVPGAGAGVLGLVLYAAVPAGAVAAAVRAAGAAQDLALVAILTLAVAGPVGVNALRLWRVALVAGGAVWLVVRAGLVAAAVGGCRARAGGGAAMGVGERLGVQSTASSDSGWPLMHTLLGAPSTVCCTHKLPATASCGSVKQQPRHSTGSRQQAAASRQPARLTLVLLGAPRILHAREGRLAHTLGGGGALEGHAVVAVGAAHRAGERWRDGVVGVERLGRAERRGQKAETGTQVRTCQCALGAVLC